MLYDATCSSRARRLLCAGALCAFLCLALCLQGCRTKASSNASASDAPAAQAKVEPYSASPEEMLDSLDLLEPPPAEGSAAFAYDQAMFKEGLRLRPTPRGEQAIRDADMRDYSAVFGEAFGLPLSKDAMPETWLLLRRLSKEAGAVCRQGKKHYSRVRPVFYNSTPTCRPESDEKLRGSGSYPSGHALRGWSFALVLAELNPARSESILKRGWEIGQSRVICGFHWQSDVNASRKIAAGMVSALHANPEFVRQLARAKDEVARVSKGQK